METARSAFTAISFDIQKSAMFSCCSKLICDGCDYVNQMREMEEKLDPRCSFCRQPRTSFTQAEIDRKK